MNHTSEIKSSKHYGEIILKNDDYEIIRCESCKYVHKNPLPSLEDLEAFYQDKFYDNKSDYLDYTEQDEYREILNEDKYVNIKKYISTTIKPKLLDIGSSGGNLIGYFIEKGWDAFGVEPSVKACRFALDRNRPTIQTTIEAFLGKNNTERYDVIHMREVIDTIIKPLTLLREIKNKLLKINGILVIDTSNDFNYLQTCIVKNKIADPWWAEGDTLNFFNRDDLKNLMLRAGYKNLHMESTFPLEMFILMGENYLGNSKIGRSIHKKRILFEKNLKNAGMSDFKHKLFELFAEKGIGRNIIVYAKK